MDIPEDVALEILARLPLKSIARFRAVRKEWTSLIDSDLFRDRFFSLKSSSSTSWSIVQTQPHKQSLEIVGHHGCRTWGLTRSLGSLVRTSCRVFSRENQIKKLSVLACTDGLVLVYAEAADWSRRYYVGNPLSREWARIPLPRIYSCDDLPMLWACQRFSDTGLVTKMESGVVVSYKVVWSITRPASRVIFKIYSSDTEMWETRSVACLDSSDWFNQHKPIALNGILHWFSNLTAFFIAYDFYEGRHGDGCSIVFFPDIWKYDEFTRFRRTLSTSEGSIVYFNESCWDSNRVLRVWRLVNYTAGPEAWELFREVSLVSLVMLGISYFPVVMHPLSSEIIYLWSMNTKGMILVNLRTRVFSLHREAEVARECMDGCILSFNRCSEYMEWHFSPVLLGGPHHLLFSQYVLPPWLPRLPRRLPRFPRRRPN